MQKFVFSIRTRSGQFIERIAIAGKDRADAERKLNQMYRHCEVIRCDSCPPGQARPLQAMPDDVLYQPSR